MDQIETTILRNLLHNETFTRRVIPFLKKEYFQGGHKVVFESMVDFVTKYNKLPTAEALSVEISDSGAVSEEDAGEVSSLLSEVQKYEPVDEQWLEDQTERWCQDRAIYIAIIESIEVIDGKHKSLSKNALPELLSDALSVCFDTHVGHDYIDDAQARYDFYHRQDVKLPFDLDYMNRITNGGLVPKSLTTILASTGAGKSLFMCHQAAAAMMDGRNVLYITMEMSEEKIAERIDANLMNVPIDQIENLSRDMFTNKITNISQKNIGKLITKEYPTGAAHAGNFRALLEELKMKKNFIPDLILVDYLNICASSRMKAIGGAVNSYTYIKSVAEEMRGLAVEFNVPVVTATQSNRDAFGSTDVDLDNTSESFGVPATSDLMIALITNEELENLGQVMIKQLKNRYADPSTNKRFVLGVDRPKMRLFDAEDSAQSLVNGTASKQQQQDSGPVFDSSGFGKSQSAERKDFSGVKV